MENEKKILKISYLDLLFKNRNKTYGAYQLRKKYEKRIFFSLSITTLLALFVSILLFPKKKNKEKSVFNTKEIILSDIQLDDQPDPIEIPPPPPPPSKKMEVPKQAVEKFTPPKIVPDKEVKKEDIAPKQEDLKNQSIGTKKEEGEKNEQLPQGTSDSKDGGGGNGDGNGPLTYVDIAAKYPGDWSGFLEKNLDYPEEAQEREIGGKIKVSFIVDVDGTVSDIKIISGPIELREVCLKVIKSSGKWIPAKKNGVNVKAYKIQEITFQLE